MRDHLRALTIAPVAALLCGACFDPAVDDTAGTEGTAATSDATGASAPGDDDGVTSAGPGGGTPGDDSAGPTSGPSTDPTTPGDTTSDPTGDPTGDPTDGGSTATDDGPPVDPCAADEVCVADAPPGWSGPAAVYRDAGAPPSCPGSLPVVGFTATTDLDAPAAQCGCDCEDAVGFSCSTTVTENGSNCTQFVFDPQQWNVGQGQCVSMSSSATAFQVGSGTLNTASASCSPSASETVAEATWNTNLQGCDVPDEAPACDGGKCSVLGDPYDTMCIYADGDAMCPAGPYTERELVYTDLTDDRSCTTCSCDDPTGTCGGHVNFASGCSGLPILYDIGNVGSCVQGVDGNASALSYSASPDVSCAPQGGTAAGSAEGTGPITVCCLP